jgi:hypothetical protein
MPVDNTPHKISYEDIVNSNSINWSLVNKKYKYLYDEKGSISKILSKNKVKHSDIIKYILDMYIESIIGDGNNKENAYLINEQKRAICNCLNSIEYVTKDVDNLKIYCIIQAYIDNTLCNLE